MALTGTGGGLSGRKREYFTIGEVCELLGIKAHVLRYWETQFPELAPPKSKAGSRLYRPKELELIARIQHLVHEERYTIEGARNKLAEAYAGSGAGAALGLDRALLRGVRAELEQVLGILDPSR